MKIRSFLPLFLLACASTKPPGTASAGGKPSCDAIDAACDPYEHEGGKAKECHDLSEAKASTEETCARRKAECLAVCPTR